MIRPRMLFDARVIFGSIALCLVLMAVYGE
jgi:hypothetical protein